MAEVVHIDLPRIFTFTVKEYLTEVDTALVAAGHPFRQLDVNPGFWRWLFALSTPHSPRDCMEPLLASLDGVGIWDAVRKVRAHLGDIATLYGVKLGLHGLDLPRGVERSSYAMATLVADNFGCGLFAGFFRYLEEQHHFLAADVISIGVDSPQGVFWAMNLAAWIRSAGAKAHITIGRHAYENFSLVHHAADLFKNPWFAGLIDSIVLYGEELASTLVALVNAPDAELANVARRRADGTVALGAKPAGRLRRGGTAYSIPAAYFDAMGVPRELVCYGMSMLRNKCFYGKCTFCVQITKHVADRAYDETSEVERALLACAELDRHGVKMVNFHDEAMRPVDLQRFCAGVREHGLSTRWVGRMIAAAKVDKALVRAMHEAGCVEILFGIETFDQPVACAMGKINGRDESLDRAIDMIDAYTDSGIFLVLSMIFGFPTENRAARELTVKTADGLKQRSRMLFIFNRFALFHTSEMFRAPRSFNIGQIEPRFAENDLQYQFDYEQERALAPVTSDEIKTFRRLRVGLDEPTYDELVRKHGEVQLDFVYALDYCSLGFKCRVERDATILSAAFGAKR